MARINQIFTVGAAPHQIALAQTLADRLSVQMKTGGSGIGYLLCSNTGGIPSKANDADIVVELAAATATAPGGAYQDYQPGGGNAIDMSAYWVDGAYAGDQIRVSYNRR
ncbi:MAG: hypothetical protein ABSF25_24785 [Bryobacteraceae bacterium]|jgi:hypothetical protein